MHPPLTYELRVSFAGDPPTAAQSKQRLIDWLLLSGVDSFVEGELAVDINQNQDEAPRDYYLELGGDQTPVSVYRYSREGLDDLRVKLERTFASQVTTRILASATDAWMEGWKESFLPFATDVFYVRPPWIQVAAPQGLVDLVIEPGMAFGTGQHATTKLCLEAIGKDARRLEALAEQSVLDVGTGTGILLIAAKKLGYGRCFGTDIEDDAILAANGNAIVNKVEVRFAKGSLPSAEDTYDLVLANILAVVLIRLMGALAAAAKPQGRLILSGLLSEEAAEVAAAGVAVGLRLIDESHLEGWACLVLLKV